LITHPVAAKEYFSRSKILFHTVNLLFRPLWITRGEADKHQESLQVIKDKLDEGHNIILFPEGTRGEPGQFKKFKSGIGRLAEQYHDLPVVPVLLSGPERALPKHSLLPLPIWNNVIIGPPQMFNISHTKVTRLLEKMIHELSEAEQVTRHRRKTKKDSPIFSIAILGIDGSGKSTMSKRLTNILSEDSNAILVSDTLTSFENKSPKYVQPLISEKLREMIGKHAKGAKSLKHYKIPKLTELLLRDHLLVEIERWYNPDFVIMDGSPLLNLTAWAILYKEGYFNEGLCLKAIQILTSKEKDISKTDTLFKKFPELSILKSLKLTHLKLPDITVFLDVDPSLSISRIEKRGERKQVHETIERLSKLRKAYHMVCHVIKRDLNIPTSIIDGDDSIDNITRNICRFVKIHLKERKDGFERKN
jgi:thymidylate kinase